MSDLLAGHFFHTWTEHDCGCRLIEWQGVVLGKVTEDAFLVELFDWMTGTPNGRRIIRADDMTDWTLYTSADAMNSFYERAYSGTWSRHESHERSA